MKLVLSKIYFCTGARNHDLLAVFKNQPLVFEYDERMASFKALGLSKISPSPVAVCTTSGTAVAECLSAMLEAKYSQLPFILISGDRPKKLHQSGSPQTIDHFALTASARGSYVELTLLELETLSIQGMKFPIHINVLIDDTSVHGLTVYAHEQLIGFERFMGQVQKPLFLFSHENKTMKPLIEKFQVLGLPFYAEALSGGREFSPIKTEKALVEMVNSKTFDSIIRIGHTPLSKIWRLLEKIQLKVFHFDSRSLPALSYGEIMNLSSKELLESSQWWSILKNVKPFSVLDNSQALLKTLMSRFPNSEVSVMKRIHDSLDSEDIVYLGNSLIIRNFELIQTRALCIYGNRGVNGIDGQLATAIGLAQGTDKSVRCILGDITTLYDLSSLREMPSNLKLIIINNKGGRIFELLKLDKRVVLEHNCNFKGMCDGFGLSYSDSLLKLPQCQVVELFPDNEQSRAFTKEWS